MNELYELALCNDIAKIKSKQWSQEELDYIDDNGKTALMISAENGNHEVALLLKDLGADLDLMDKDGLKAVNLAARNGHSIVLACLIEGGCGG